MGAGGTRQHGCVVAAKAVAGGGGGGPAGSVIGGFFRASAFTFSPSEIELLLEVENLENAQPKPKARSNLENYSNTKIFKKNFGSHFRKDVVFRTILRSLKRFYGDTVLKSDEFYNLSVG